MCRVSCLVPSRAHLPVYVPVPWGARRGSPRLASARNGEAARYWGQGGTREEIFAHAGTYTTAAHIECTGSHLLQLSIISRRSATIPPSSLNRPVSNLITTFAMSIGCFTCQEKREAIKGTKSKMRCKTPQGANKPTIPASTVLDQTRPDRADKEYV